MISMKKIISILALLLASTHAAEYRRSIYHQIDSGFAASSANDQSNPQQDDGNVIPGQPLALGQTVEITRHVGYPFIQQVAVPVPQHIAVEVPQPYPVGVPQPYPVHVAVPHPVAVPVIRTHTVTVEKPVPYEVEKPIAIPVDRPYPVHIERKVPVPIYRPYPVAVPVVRHIYHHTNHNDWD